MSVRAQNLERKSRQKAHLRDLQALAYSGAAGAYESGYGTRRASRGATVNYNVDSYFNSVGLERAR